MPRMFEGASAFNTRLKEWDVSRVTDMGSMFRYASSFNQDLSGWSTGNVVYMGQMFEYATSFGYYFESFRFDDDPSVVWDTSNVVNMESMFRHCLHLTSVPFHWDVSSVTSMQRMFEGADNFRPEAFADWNTSSVTDFSYLLAMNDPCLLYTSPSPRDKRQSRMPSSA